MAKESEKSTWLEGKQVACTGSLACMTRAKAADLIHAFGGRFVPSVTRKTNILLVGQDGWPLQTDGTLSGKLQRAQRLQRAGFPIHIVPEEEFLERIGLAEQSSGVRRLFTMAQVCGLLSVSRDRLRRWIDASLLQPAESHHGVNYFDFPQVSGLKTLSELTCAGASTKELRRSLEHLRTWMPHLGRPLEQLALLERDGQLMVRLDEGQLAEASGQLQFDFERKEEPEENPQVRTAEEWFELGCAEEEADCWTQAAAAYRQALTLGGPDPIICFNLGNVLYALDQKGQAAERFRQAVELNPDFAEAWNNLGNSLADLDQHEEAIEAYRQVLVLDREFPDVHFNLADTLERIERWKDACAHWREYLRFEGKGPYADYARNRLLLTKWAN